MRHCTSDWHESATVSELLISRAAWAPLPKDLQSSVDNGLSTRKAQR